MYRLFLLVSVVFFCPSRSLNAQDEGSVNNRAESLRSNIVRLTIYDRESNAYNGLGIVVGEAEEQLIVVTARHVLGGLEEEVEVDSISAELFNQTDIGNPYKEKGVVGNADFEEDFAILLINRPPDFTWKKRSLDAAMFRKDPKAIKRQEVAVVGYEKGWQLQPNQPGKIDNNLNSAPNKLDTLFVGDDFTYPGLSGTAFISKDGIVAMYLANDEQLQKSYAYPIKKIKKLVEDKGYSFQATTTNFQLPKPNSIRFSLGLEVGLGFSNGSEIMDSDQSFNLFTPAQAMGGVEFRYDRTYFSFLLAYRFMDYTGTIDEWNELDPKIHYGIGIEKAGRYRIEAFYGKQQTRGNTILTESSLFNLKVGKPLGNSATFNHHIFLGLTYLRNRQSYLIDATIFNPETSRFEEISSNDEFLFNRLVLGLSYSIRLSN